MHSAPAVRYPVARSVRAGAFLLGVWSLAAGVCLWWWLWGGAAAWSMAAALLSLLLGAVLAFVQWRDMPVGDLRWDGQAWWWQFAGEDEVSVSVAVRLDLQRGLLLHMAGQLPRNAHWCYAERAQLPARWSDLRRALYAPFSSMPAPASGAALLP